MVHFSERSVTLLSLLKDLNHAGLSFSRSSLQDISTFKCGIKDAMSHSLQNRCYTHVGVPHMITHNETIQPCSLDIRDGSQLGCQACAHRNFSRNDKISWVKA
ncbi:uncharacterized protein LOC119980247 [Tripterygium wilfordii]|uniref:uncharacterized protein LOC119980247 n=1 Tax=Tripterygium wilfordii TaxID=458696 RepID=UPI0018F7EEB5|nr:uncharacterized protein LOC119980247 [Tripterygium wilfordii]